MIGIEHALAIGQHVGVAFDAIVRRQPAGGPAERHAAARQMQAHPELFRGFEHRLDPDVAAGWEHVEVVAGGGAAVQ